ncbi:MAG: ABC transporter ATP-binding protein [Candidatus Scatomorpha sp.]|jgi:ABC-2 type transport system ATP-binding protein
MIQNMIEIEKISKSFGSRTLFEDFSLDIKNNSIHAIIGPNGSGKTTLLRMLTGLYEIDGGRIKSNGSHAMLLENDYLYEEKSGLENLKLFGLYFGYKAQDYERYSDLLNLTGELDKRVSTYSKGMKRKLSLLVVIMMNRDIIYLDEATSGVDPISRVEIRKIISQLKNDGKTVIITSHDLSEVEKIAEQITMIKEGDLVFNLSHKEIEGKSLEDIFIKAGERNE